MYRIRNHSEVVLFFAAIFHVRERVGELERDSAQEVVLKRNASYVILNACRSRSVDGK